MTRHARKLVIASMVVIAVWLHVTMCEWEAGPVLLGVSQQRLIGGEAVSWNASNVGYDGVGCVPLVWPPARPAATDEMPRVRLAEDARWRRRFVSILAATIAIATARRTALAMSAAEHT